MQWKWVVAISAIIVLASAVYLFYPKFVAEDPEVKWPDAPVKLQQLEDGRPPGFRGPSGPPSIKGPTGPPPE